MSKANDKNISREMYDVLALKAAESAFDNITGQIARGIPSKNALDNFQKTLSPQPGVDADYLNSLHSAFNQVFSPIADPATNLNEIRNNVVNDLKASFLNAWNKIPSGVLEKEHWGDEERQYLNQLFQSAAYESASKSEAAQNAAARTQTGFTDLSKLIESRKIEAKPNETDAERKNREAKNEELKKVQEAIENQKKRLLPSPPTSTTPQLDNNKKKDKEEKKQQQQQQQQEPEKNLLKELHDKNQLNENAILMAIIMDWIMLVPAMTVELVGRTIKYGPRVAILQTLRVIDVCKDDPDLSGSILKELSVSYIKNAHPQSQESAERDAEAAQVQQAQAQQAQQAQAARNKPSST